MAFIFDQTTKPSRYTNEKKGEEYHLQTAKYYLFSGYDSRHQKWLRDIAINKKFYKGDQWVKDEDVQTFLKGETGDDTTRIKFVYNVIRPMIEQYRGNAIMLNINAQAKSISRQSLNRKEKRLAEQLFKTRAANEFYNVGQLMKQNDISIGNDEAQTETIFENTYVDSLVDEINDLLTYSKKLNRFAKKQVKVALDLALTGLAVQMSVLHGGHHRFEGIEAEDFIFDRDAREPDLSDAEFMGTMNPMDIPSITERWQTNPETARALDQYIQDIGNTQSIEATEFNNYSSNKLPVVTMYWKDSERYKYGWVKDEDGYPVLERIGERKDDSDLDNYPKYTEKDLITPPDTPRNRRLFPNGNKTAMLYCDIVRYCTYIPGELVSTRDTEKKLPDLVLEYGKDPYQETNYQDLSNVKFPFKVHTWGYVDGEVFSPVDDVIDPQRFMNRMLSLSEARMNASGGSNVVIDEDAVEDPAETQADIKAGRAITVRTRGKGIPNTVGYYDATPKAGVYQMFDMVNGINGLVQNMTGVNEAIKGESTGSDQLVGVTKLMIQRGSLMQEPFYNAVSDIFLQMYESVASVGKKYYLDNEAELAIVSGGDDAVKIFKLSQDLRNEDFSIFVERENSDEILTQNANQMLQVFLEMGLVDQQVFANLYDRSTPSKVMRDVRSYVKMQMEAQKQAEQEAAAQEQAAMQQQNEMMSKEMAERQASRRENNAAKLEGERIKSQGKMDEILAKSMLEGSQNQPTG